MRERITWLFTPPKPYADPIQAQRARGLLYFLAAAFVISLIVVVIGIIGSQAVTLENDSIDIEQISVVITPFFVLISFWAVRAGYYQATAYALVVFSLVAIYPVATGNLEGVSLLGLVLPIVISGTLLSWRTTLLSLVLTLGMVSLSTIFAPTGTVKLSDFFIISVVLTLVSFYLLIFGTNIQISASRFLQGFESLRGLISSTVEQATAYDEMSLMSGTINLIRDNLGIPFARLYLVEKGEVSQRIQTGLNLSQLNVDTDVELGVNSAIYEAIRQKQVITLNSTNSDASRQHLLSGTRGALAIPVMADNEVIAVLDIQADDKEVFAEGDIQILRLLARQLGMNLRQMRRMIELRNDLDEQGIVIERQRERLLNLERRERQATTEAWASYLRQRGIEFMGFDMTNQNLLPETAYNLNSDLQDAIQTGEITVRQDGEEQVISVPIALRGYTLGAMSFRVPEGAQAIGPRQQELIRSVVQRLGLALENKRLFEQSQAQALRESKANEVGSMLLSTTDINAVLRLAVENFNSAMGAIQTQIVIQPAETSANSGEQ